MPFLFLAVFSAFLFPALTASADSFMPLPQEEIQEEEAKMQDAYLDALEAQISKHPDARGKAGKYAAIASKAYSFGKFDLAEKYAALALSENNDSSSKQGIVQANVILSAIASDGGDAEKAAQYATAAIHADSDEWMGYYALARMHDAVYQKTGVEDALKDAISNYAKAGGLLGEDAAFYVGEPLKTLSEKADLKKLFDKQERKGISRILKEVTNHGAGDYFAWQKLRDMQEAKKWQEDHHGFSKLSPWILH